MELGDTYAAYAFPTLPHVMILETPHYITDSQFTYLIKEVLNTMYHPGYPADFLNTSKRQAIVPFWLPSNWPGWSMLGGLPYCLSLSLPWRHQKYWPLFSMLPRAFDNTHQSSALHASLCPQCQETCQPWLVPWQHDVVYQEQSGCDGVWGDRVMVRMGVTYWVSQIHVQTADPTLLQHCISVRDIWGIDCALAAVTPGITGALRCWTILYCAFV